MTVACTMERCSLSYLSPAVEGHVADGDYAAVAQKSDSKVITAAVGGLVCLQQGAGAGYSRCAAPSAAHLLLLL